MSANDPGVDRKNKVFNWAESEGKTVPARRSEPPQRDAPIAKLTLAFAAMLVAGLVGNQLATQTVGERGWQDELVALVFGVSGSGVTLGFLRKLCEDRPKTTDGTWTVASSGAGIGLGIAALTAAPLISWIDGGVIAGTVLIPTGLKLLQNRRAGTKICPWCRRPQQCNKAVCRNCLNIFFPAAVPDCNGTYELGWYEIASFFYHQKLNYIETISFLKDHWSLSIENGLVGCKEFVTWAAGMRDTMRQYRKKVTRSAQTDQLLDMLNV